MIDGPLRVPNSPLKGPQAQTCIHNDSKRLLAFVSG